MPCWGTLRPPTRCRQRGLTPGAQDPAARRSTKASTSARRYRLRRRPPGSATRSIRPLCIHLRNVGKLTEQSWAAAGSEIRKRSDGGITFPRGTYGPRRRSTPGRSADLAHCLTSARRGAPRKPPRQRPDTGCAADCRATPLDRSGHSASTCGTSAGSQSRVGRRPLQREGCGHAAEPPHRGLVHVMRPSAASGLSAPSPLPGRATLLHRVGIGSSRCL
jgi:hypothetical protein